MRTLPVLLVSAVLIGCSEGTRAGDPEATEPRYSFEDPEVTRIYERMMEKLAPDRGWERARYIRFDWAVYTGEGEPGKRFHRWDRYTGEYRLEAPTGDGRMVALFNVDRPGEGRVWIDGELVEGERRAELLERAHAVFINDTYWLLMPYKWDDPGVHTEHLGERTDEEGRTWEVVKLTFDEGVGRTPRNEYLAFIDPESGIMERWHHFRTAGVEPLVADWTEWRKVGPIMLAGDRPLAGGGGRHIAFEDLVVSETVPQGAFEPPPGAETPSDSVESGAAGGG